jgi:hypothetical protein
MKLLMGFGIDFPVVMNRNFVGLHESGENKTARITYQEGNSENLSPSLKIVRALRRAGRSILQSKSGVIRLGEVRCGRILLNKN